MDNPVDIVACPIIHLGVEVVGPIRAGTIAQDQNPRGNFRHLLKVTISHEIHVSILIKELIYIQNLQ
jgi:hypothetical protein